MTKKTKISYLLLGLTFILGLSLRLYRLNQNIPPLYADETGQYFLLDKIVNHSADPLRYILSFTVSFTWLLGLSPLGVRLPSALFGSFLAVLAYFFSLQFSKGSRKVSLICAALTAVMPWSYMISRIGHTHVTIVVLMAMLHITLFLGAKTWTQKLISFIPFLIGGYCYPSLIIMSPLVLFFPIKELLTENSLNKKYLFVSLAIFIAVVSYTMVGKYKIFSSSARGLDLAIWRDVNTPWQIDKYRALSWNSEPSLFSFYMAPEKLANKLVYNRPVAQFTTFTRNYLSFFSLDWLFLRGDPILRHSTSQVGELYPFLLPFMLYGAFTFFKTSSNRHKWTFILWILASPIPAAITKDGSGYLLRAITLMPFLTYFSALGVVESFNLIKKNWRIPYGLVISIAGIYSVYFFFFGYFHVYPSLSARSYEYGFKELSDFQVNNGYATLLVIWDGYYHNNDFRFWQKTSFYPVDNFKMKQVQVGGSEFNQTFSNLYFVNPKSLSDLQVFMDQNIVDFIVLPDRYFVNYSTDIDQYFATASSIIKYPDQTPALRIFDVRLK